MVVRGKVDGPCSGRDLAGHPTVHLDFLDGISIQGGAGRQELGQGDPLDIAGRIDARIQESVPDHQMAEIGHRAHDAAQIGIVLQIDDGDSSSAAHAAHEQEPVVRRKHRPAQAVAAVHVPVHLVRETVIEIELIVDDDVHHVVPVLRPFGRDVHQPDRIVTPMGDGQPFSVRRGGNHLGKRSRLEKTHDLVPFRINHRHGRRILCVQVEASPVIGYPQIPSPMGERALDRLPGESLRMLVVVAESIEAGRRGPEGEVLLAELVADDLQLFARLEIIDHRLSPFQGIDVVFLTGRMDVHRLRRLDVHVVGGLVFRREMLFPAHEGDPDPLGGQSGSHRGMDDPGPPFQGVRPGRLRGSEGGQAENERQYEDAESACSFRHVKL